jgi:NAD(P)-dependent dehydrogenase (short-subunit alcohol dehydrogenase family)
LATNFYGTLNLCNQLYPLIRPNGRLINISSSVGMLKVLSSPELQKEFSREDLDIDELIGLMKKFENDVENNQWIKEGWPSKGKSLGGRFKKEITWNWFNYFSFLQLTVYLRLGLMP